MRLLPLALALAGCADPDRVATRPDPVAAAPAITLEPPPAGSRARLVRVLRVTADREVVTRVTLDAGVDRVRTVEPPQRGRELEIALPGFRLDRDTTVEVEVLDAADGTVVGTAWFEVAAEPIATGFHEWSLTANRPREDRGDTLFPVKNNFLGGYVVLVDPLGEPIFVFEGGGGWWRSAQLTPDGRLLLIGDREIVLTDWADLDPRTFAPPPGTSGYHHEAIPRPGGGFFALNAGPLHVPDFPHAFDRACDPGGPATIWDNVLVEADADGNVLETWSLGERLDTHRIGWDSLTPGPTGPDWGHANGFDYVEADDSFVISMRNQELMLKLSRATGEVLWLLSNPDGWAPEFEPLRLRPLNPEHRWHFHQHAPEWLDGRLLFHDNGAVGGMPCSQRPAQPLGTRIVELELDEVNGEFYQRWAWSNGLFSPIMGDADRIPGDLVLATYGGTVEDEAGVLHRQRGHGDEAARLIEIDPATGEVWWDLEIYEGNRDENPGGFQVPRSRRLATWWPQP